MKKYVLTVARVEQSGEVPLLFVQIPWKHFEHRLGPPEYQRVIAQCMPASTVKYLPVSVSLAPNGEWHCDKFGESHWKRILSTAPVEKLAWHKMQVEADESPAENMEKYLRVFPRMS